MKQFKVSFSTFLPSRNFATKATFFRVAFVTDKKKDHQSLLFGQIGRATAVLRNKAIKDVKKKKEVHLRFVSIVAQEENR